MQTLPDPSQAQAVAIKLDPVSLVLHSSGPVFIVVWSLVAAAALVWIIAVMKLLQIARLATAQRRFDKEAMAAGDAEQLFVLAHQHPGAPGARIVIELAKRAGSPKLLDSAAKRAIVEEQQRASVLMPTLSSIASASPFVGLFGTVYGIMDAFLRIGQEKSASLPVVAPAIGEALIATAIGLFAAIPAVVAYNAISKRIDDLLSSLEASAAGWVALAESAGEASSVPMPLRQHQGSPRQPPPPHGPPVQRFPHVG